MSPRLVVRRAEPGDVDEIYRVTRQSRQEAFADLLPADALDWDATVSDEYREFVEDIISSEAKAQLVADRDGTVVGLAELAWQAAETQEFVGDPEAELKAIHVRPDYWNEGVGTELVEKMVDTLPSRLSGIALGVLAGNDRARAFYERRGFEQRDTITRTISGNEYTEAVYRRPLR